MRLVKLAIISLIAFGVLLTVISLLMPSTILVSKSININAPKDSVYAHIFDLRNWKDWCANMESTTVKFSVNTIGKGAIATADKTTVIIDSCTLTSIATTWQSNSSVLTSSFNILPNDNASITSLQWQFTNHVSWYPWEKFAAIFSDKAIGGFMEKSLDKMKATLEKRH